MELIQPHHPLLIITNCLDFAKSNSIHLDANLSIFFTIIDLVYKGELGSKWGNFIICYCPARCWILDNAHYFSEPNLSEHLTYCVSKWAQVGSLIIYWVNIKYIDSCWMFVDLLGKLEWRLKQLTSFSLCPCLPHLAHYVIMRRALTKQTQAQCA